MKTFNILFFLTALILSCSQKQEKKKQANDTIAALFLGTVYLPCPPHKFSNTISFNDDRGDVRAGFLQSTEGVTYEDIVSGTIANNATFNVSLTLGQLPATLPINLITDTTVPEHQFTLNLKNGIDEFKIGIAQYSTGNKQNIPLNSLPVQVFKNTVNTGGCGTVTVTGNTMDFKCDKTLVTELNAINDTFDFNLAAVHNDGRTVFRDCY